MTSPATPARRISISAAMCVVMPAACARRTRASSVGPYFTCRDGYADRSLRSAATECSSGVLTTAGRPEAIVPAMTTPFTEAPIRSAVETAPREVLHDLQLRRLRTALARREVAVPVETLDDLRHVPFTVKDDLRASYPLGMMTVPGRELVRLHS